MKPESIITEPGQDEQAEETLILDTQDRWFNDSESEQESDNDMIERKAKAFNTARNWTKLVQ